MYRISDSYLNTKYPTPQFNLGSEENCFLWQSQTSKSIPLNDIYTVVYTSPVGEILDVLTHGRKAGDENKFKRWLRHDKEAAEFLLLAKREEIVDHKIDSSKVKAFLCPKGTMIEVYATALHYAPCQASKDSGFQVLVGLPKGTNVGMPSFTPANQEDKLMTATNKWLLAHAESSEAKNGAWIGITGENIDIAADI